MCGSYGNKKKLWLVLLIRSNTSFQKQRDERSREYLWKLIHKRSNVVTVLSEIISLADAAWPIRTVIEQIRGGSQDECRVLRCHWPRPDHDLSMYMSTVSTNCRCCSCGVTSPHDLAEHQRDRTFHHRLPRQSIITDSQQSSPRIFQTTVP